MLYHLLKIIKQINLIHIFYNYCVIKIVGSNITYKGTTDKIKGKVKEAASDAKDKVENMVDDVKEKLDN